MTDSSCGRALARRIRSTRRTLAPAAGAALLALAAALGACHDPTAINADLAIVEDTLNVYTLTRTPVNVPTAFSVSSRTVVRAETGAAFDVAFDIDSTGKIVLIPAQLVGTGLGSAAIQTVSTPFASLGRAPDSGTYADSVVTTLQVGQTAVVRSRPSVCSASFKGPEMYAKLVVDSVNVTRRVIYFRARVDPNCGFKDLGAGIPKS